MKGLVCVSGVDLLMDYFDGELAPDVRAVVERHVAECPRCAAFLVSYQEAPRILRDATAMKLPPDLESSLLAAVRSRLDREAD